MLCPNVCLQDSNPATPCVSCPSGTYVPPGSTLRCNQLDCPAGTIDHDYLSTTQCERCGAGSYVAAGQSGSCDAHR